jgi:hypothetical protein
MFYGQSDAKRKTLMEVQQYFRYADSHPTITGWRTKAVEDFGFYDGTGQWPKSILEDLRRRGQYPVTVNKIKNLVNYMSGVEIQTRFRVAYRDDSGNPENELLAKALTHYTYAIQEHQDMPHKASMTFRDSLVTGIGWGNIFKEGATYIDEYVNPFNMLFDPDDLSPELTEMNFLVRLRWIPVPQAKQWWPHYKDYFDNFFSPTSPLSQYASSGAISGELAMRLSGYVDVYASGNGGSGSRVLIVEVQYKKPKKAFEGIDLNGHYFKTFNEEEAEELSDGQQFEEVDATQIMRSLFTADILLEHAPLNPNLPDLPDFTYIPTIWTRIFESGIPDGWVSVMKDVQRESNYRRAKLIYNLNSFRAVVDADALPGMSLEDIRHQVSRPDSVLIKAPGNDITIESNSPLADGQFKMLERTDQELQQVSGIYNDALGEPTNATSGIAIQNRQLNSVRNQVFAFDNLRLMKKRQGHMLLNLIQGGGDEYIQSQIMTPDEQQAVTLNMVREVGGKKVVFNDVRTLPLSIYVEEVPDFESSIEEKRASLEALLGNGNAQWIMQSPRIMKLLGFRDWEEIASEMQQVNQQQIQMEQAAKGGMAPAQEAALGDPTLAFPKGT